MTLAVLLVVVACPAMAQQRLLISGYGNVHYMDHDGTARLRASRWLDQGFFQIREFSLFFDVAISDRIIASTELEAGDNGTRYTANYAYVQVEATPSLGFRVGKILVPFLSYNENKPNFKQHLMSQPFTAWNLAPVNGIAIEFSGFGWSDAGVMADWTSPLGDFGLLNLKAAVINGLGSDLEALDGNTVQLEAGEMNPVVRPRDGLIQNEGVNGLRDNNSNKATVAKLTLRTGEWPLDLGLSWYRGDWDPESRHDLQMWGAHLNWLSSVWTLKGELALATVDQQAGLDPVAASGQMGPAALNTTTGDYGMHAWYVEGSVVPLRWDRERYVRLIARYDDVDTNDEAPFTPFDRSRVTLGSEWQFTPQARLRYEWQRAVIDDFANAPAPYRAAGGEEIVQMHMASVIFWF